MKTETEIARELVDNVGCDVDVFREQEVHLASCKRFLEFLKKKDVEIDKLEYELTDGFPQNDFDVDLSEKIQDLQEAIKIYEENGIE